MIDLRRLAALAAMLLVAACDESTRPVENNSNLNFLEPAPTAPAVGAQTLTFNAVQGQDNEVFMYYPQQGTSERSKILRLRIRAEAQIVRPNGTNLTTGQSIPITITIVDPVRLIVDFQPSGLRFLGEEAADLTMWYDERDHDFNDDGAINATDSAIEQTLGIFRRETLTAPWVRLSGNIVVETDEIEADISGFTNYVIAY